MVHATDSEATNILITGAAGFLGQALARSLMSECPSAAIILTDVTKPDVPEIENQVAKAKCSVRSLAADLTSKETCQTMFTADLTHVYLLHGVMSGAAEANYDLGIRVNVDSMRHIMDALRVPNRQAPVKVVFPSSLAVFGPADEETMVTEQTKTSPRSSYGTAKAMTELLLDDMSRRGFIDACIVRLPTIIVRPGKPSGAASSFCSSIIREPLNGERALLPVDRNLKLWVCSTRTVVRNLVAAKDIAAKQFASGSRIVNLPGKTVTVNDMLKALKEVGGQDAVKMVQEAPDASVQRIVGSWPAMFDVSHARLLGFHNDVPLYQAVKDYIEDFI